MNNIVDKAFKIEREDGNRLLELLQEAHYKAGRDNPSVSRAVFWNAYAGSSNPVGSCAAALLSVGGVHAPLTETRNLVRLMVKDVEQFSGYVMQGLVANEKIPGLGNSFYKDRIDPAFDEVNDFYRQLHMDHDLGLTYVDTYAAIVNELIQERNKTHPKTNQSTEKDMFEEYQPLFPNAALITAAIVEFLGGKKYIENWVFISGRTRAWLEMCSTIHVPAE